MITERAIASIFAGSREPRGSRVSVSSCNALLWIGSRKIYFKDVNNLNPSVELTGGAGIFRGIRRFNDGSLYFKRNDNNNDDLMRIDQADTQSPTTSVQQVIGNMNIPSNHTYEFKGVWAAQPHRLYPSDDFVYRNIGEKHYEINDHLGNVRATVTDRKVASMTGVGTQNFAITAFTADIETANDYYPFGWTMPGRQYNPGDYRYGFQGQEKDDEIKGAGNMINYKYRMHDPRLGRFLSLDPLAPDYPHNSPYAFSENRVIDGVELKGLEWLSQFRSMMRYSGFSKQDEKDIATRTKATMQMAGRYGGSGVLIVGGVVTIVASAGTSTPGVVAAFGILSGSYATAAGAAKLSLDISGQSDRADQIPTTYLDATVGLTIEGIAGESRVTTNIRGVLSVAEGVVTAKLYKPPKEFLEALDKGLTITNIILDTPEHSSTPTQEDLQQEYYDLKPTPQDNLQVSPELLQKSDKAEQEFESSKKGS